MTPLAVATKIKMELAANKIPFGAVLEGNRDDKKPENNTSKIYWTVKLHKLNNAGEQTFPARFIISGSKSPTASLSSLLSGILVHMQSALDTIFSNVYAEAGVDASSSTILNSSRDFLSVLDLFNTVTTVHERRTTPPVLSTRDVTQMYTNIPIDDCVDKVSRIVKEVFELKRAANNGERMAMCVTASKITWVKAKDVWEESYNRTGKLKNTLTNTYITFDGFKGHLKYLLANLYFKFGEEVFRQIIGLPMGTNCAPQLANFFMAYYELAYLRKLVTEYKIDRTAASRQRVADFRYVKRYIDDIGAVNNLTFINNLGDVYPAYLRFTGSPGPTMNFLDITIRQSVAISRHLETVLYDKRREPAFARLKIKKYTHWSSAIPRTSKLGILKSQFIRLGRITSNDVNYIYEAAEICWNLVTESSFSRAAVARNLWRLMENNPYIRSHRKPRFVYRQVMTAWHALDKKAR